MLSNRSGDHVKAYLLPSRLFASGTRLSWPAAVLVAVAWSDFEQLLRVPHGAIWRTSGKAE